MCDPTLFVCVRACVCYIIPVQNTLVKKTTALISSVLISICNVSQFIKDEMIYQENCLQGLSNIPNSLPSGISSLAAFSSSCLKIESIFLAVFVFITSSSSNLSSLRTISGSLQISRSGELTWQGNITIEVSNATLYHIHTDTIHSYKNILTAILLMCIPWL